MSTCLLIESNEIRQSSVLPEVGGDENAAMHVNLSRTAKGGEFNPNNRRLWLQRPDLFREGTLP
jgi:hypothetical protein